MVVKNKTEIASPVLATLKNFMYSFKTSSLIIIMKIIIQPEVFKKKKSF